MTENQDFSTGTATPPPVDGDKRVATLHSPALGVHALFFGDTHECTSDEVF
jgi:hypothetical protein